MKPESKGFAPGGNATSAGLRAMEGSPSTECRGLASLTHSIVCPVLIVTLSGRNLGGLSLILTTTAGAFAAIAGERDETPNEAIIAIAMIAASTAQILKRMARCC